MNAPRLITFGCRLNSFESEIIRDKARAAGLDDAVIVNTCTVTGEAVRQARQAIRRARRERPSARIIVTGCAAQVEPGLFAAMPEVDLVLGNREKFDPARLAARTASKLDVGDIMAADAVDDEIVDGLEGRARAYLRVQNGCDHRCTFCIVPFARGRSRSIALDAAVRQARRLVENGYAEIALTGVDIASYGGDLDGRPGLGRLCKAILKDVPELKRLRLSSLDLAGIDEDLFDLIGGEERLMPHLHLSLQSGDDMILKRMKRRHSRADAIAFSERARRARPGIALGADLIAGFPTETDAEFENSLRLIDECGLSHLHVFPFSPRAGTPAARMPEVAPRVRKERAARLRAVGERAFAAFLGRQIGSRASVLVETRDEARGLATGRTERYAPIAVPCDAPPGAIVPVRVAAVEGGALKGEAAA